MIISHNDLIKRIDEVINSERYEDSELFILMRWGYSLKELITETLMLETVYYNDLNESLIWYNDWWEGQDYVELIGIYTQSEIRNILLKEDKDG